MDIVRRKLLLVTIGTERVKLQLPLQQSYLQLKFVLFLFQHPFIVDLIYAFQTGGKLYLILEYLSGMFSSHYLQMG